MKNGFLIFLAAFVLLGSSWCGFVLAPTLQLGAAKQTQILNSSDIYPVQRNGDATLGLQVYRASGCAACHTEQIQQSGFACDVVLTSAGTNQARIITSLLEFTKDTGGLNGTNLQKIIVHDISKTAADYASDKITAAGGKVETRILATGADISRDWGIRRSVAEDFLWDYPVQLGSIRVGPDLADVGRRFPDANWQLLHLYSPQSVTKNSAMPPFRFLFEMRKIGDAPSPDALSLPKELALPAGYEIVPTAAAKNIAAYLLSLRADVPLYDAPFTPPQISTNVAANKK
jgi:cbb3-type cytochrome oxidase cytochrome c subunit